MVNGLWSMINDPRIPHQPPLIDHRAVSRSIRNPKSQIQNRTVSFLTIFFGSLVVSFSGALMPGPVTITAIERSARGGAAAAAFVGVGHAILELFVTVGLAIGLLSVNAPAAKAVVGMVGGAVLVWMGVGMWKSARTAELRQAAGG
ncbi:MAG: hypothetical protein FJ272_22235, partial [Planctomycetes bacterium]|nr:hypothetical protein [Planctomycetota bacterium]